MAKKLKLWFDKDQAKMLAGKILEVDPKFNKQKFIKSFGKQLDPFELKQRVEYFADTLHKNFGEDYIKGVETLLKILGPENKEETGMFTNFYWLMPMAKYVEKFGLDEYKLSIKAIEEITKRNTGEYAIRPFIEKHNKKTINQMVKWSKNSNNHVRRLASEGIRPRLPWASKLDIYIKDPTPIYPILENLKDDKSKYVQKSVANCLNDILKDNYDSGKKLINNWNKKKISPERVWIIKHSLRSLTKKEDSWAEKVVAGL